MTGRRMNKRMNEMNNYRAYMYETYSGGRVVA